jgi:hypothetical protein
MIAPEGGLSVSRQCALLWIAHSSYYNRTAGTGLSGISCAAGRLNQSGHGQCEALAEQDGELGLGHRPLARRRDPLLFGAVQDQEEELGGGFVTGEMTPGPNRSAQLGIERLDSIGRV